MNRALALLAIAIALIAPTTARARPATTPSPATLAIIGDTPYGAAQVADFPNDVAARSTPTTASRRVIHLGDIKRRQHAVHGRYFAQIRAASTPSPTRSSTRRRQRVDRLPSRQQRRLQPVERLAKLRELFFDVPGRRWASVPIECRRAARPPRTPSVPGRCRVRDGSHRRLEQLAARRGPATAAPTPEQLARGAYPLRRPTSSGSTGSSLARADGAAGVAIGIQADMWDPAGDGWLRRARERLADRAHAFGKPVLLLRGRLAPVPRRPPLTPGDPLYGASTGVSYLPYSESPGVSGWSTRHLCESPSNSSTGLSNA